MQLNLYFTIISWYFLHFFIWIIRFCFLFSLLRLELLPSAFDHVVPFASLACCCEYLLNYYRPNSWPCSILRLGHADERELAPQGDRRGGRWCDGLLLLFCAALAGAVWRGCAAPCHLLGYSRGQVRLGRVKPFPARWSAGRPGFGRVHLPSCHSWRLSGCSCGRFLLIPFGSPRVLPGTLRRWQQRCSYYYGSYLGVPDVAPCSQWQDTALAPSASLEAASEF